MREMKAAAWQEWRACAPEAGFRHAAAFCVIRNMRRSVWKGISMAKAKSTGFFCRECGYESSKWMGQCPACKAWNTMVEAPSAPASSGTAAGRYAAAASLTAAPGKRVGAQAAWCVAPWCWSAEIRESENQPCFCRSAGTWQDRNKRFYTSPARSH